MFLRHVVVISLYSMNYICKFIMREPQNPSSHSFQNNTRTVSFDCLIYYDLQGYSVGIFYEESKLLSGNDFNNVCYFQVKFNLYFDFFEAAELMICE